MEHLPNAKGHTKTREPLTLAPTYKIRAIIQKDLFRTVFMSKCCRFGVLYTFKFLGKLHLFILLYLLNFHHYKLSTILDPLC